MSANTASPRPKDLKDAVARGAGGDRDAHLHEFLDEFYAECDAEVRTSMTADEPAMTGDDRFDAYVAAVAEHLAFHYDLPVHGWCLKPGRFLHRAYFPCGLDNLKATYLVESPTSFRRRMIFVEADPLYRPRRKEPYETPWGQVHYPGARN